jgi:NAD(P)-dependent dehydrogenase (short-subunit alcohol dehydrogenase family)
LREIREAGGEGFPVVADMSEPGQIVDMVGEVARQGGHIDYLVSNAAINPFMPWNETTVEQWDLICNTNLRGTWIVTTETAKQMVAEGHGGAIVCVSSISAHVGAPYQTAYCATKGGISMLAKALGSVLGAHGIRVNCIEPGTVLTNMSSPKEPEVLQYYLDRVALHRIGRPEEMAGTIAFLLSDDASYVTSATLLADGGFVVNAELI